MNKMAGVHADAQAIMAAAEAAAGLVEAGAAAAPAPLAGAWAVRAPKRHREDDDDEILEMVRKAKQWLAGAGIMQLADSLASLSPDAVHATVALSFTCSGLYASNAKIARARQIMTEEVAETAGDLGATLRRIRAPGGGPASADDCTAILSGSGQAAAGTFVQPMPGEGNEEAFARKARERLGAALLSPHVLASVTSVQWLTMLGELHRSAGPMGQEPGAAAAARAPAAPAMMEPAPMARASAEANAAMIRSANASLEVVQARAAFAGAMTSRTTRSSGDGASGASVSASLTAAGSVAGMVRRVMGLDGVAEAMAKAMGRKSMDFELSVAVPGMAGTRPTTSSDALRMMRALNPVAARCAEGGIRVQALTAIIAALRLEQWQTADIIAGAYDVVVTPYGRETSMIDVARRWLPLLVSGASPAAASAEPGSLYAASSASSGIDLVHGLGLGVALLRKIPTWTADTLVGLEGGGDLGGWWKFWDLEVTPRLVSTLASGGLHQIAGLELRVDSMDASLALTELLIGLATIKSGVGRMLEMAARFRSEAQHETIIRATFHAVTDAEAMLVLPLTTMPAVLAELAKAMTPTEPRATPSSRASSRAQE